MGTGVYFSLQEVMMQDATKGFLEWLFGGYGGVPAEEMEAILE